MVPALKPWCQTSWTKSLNIWPNQIGETLFPVSILPWRLEQVEDDFPACLSWRVSSQRDQLTPSSQPAGRSWHWPRNLSVILLWDPVSKATKSTECGPELECGNIEKWTKFVTSAQPVVPGFPALQGPLHVTLPIKQLDTLCWVPGGINSPPGFCFKFFSFGKLFNL